MKTGNKQVCFVTNELYPATPGGIGRVVSNLIRDGHRRGAKVDFHILVPCWSAIQKESVELAFGGKVTFHRATSLETPEHQKRWGAAYPPRFAFTDTVNHADSLELMLELKHLEKTGHRFDVVEFTDYLGWAFATLQERRQGLAFANTTVGVRLHSTDGIVQKYDQTVPNMQHLGTFELERRSLEDADVVVSHLEAIVDENVRFYGFDDVWRRKVVVEFPPLEVEPVKRRVTERRHFAFITKVQHVKRPDLFVRGAALYFLANPKSEARAVFACHMPSEDMSATIRKMVPAALADRFAFPGAQIRDEIVGDSVVVIPSEYESLNLAAYEAAAAGATVVLNGKCPAFKPGSPWVDGVNCHLFDGTPEGLANALQRAQTSPHPESVEPRADAPYFERASQASAVNAAANSHAPKVSVLITNYNLAAWLPKAIESVAASTWPNIELVIVDDASTQPLDAAVLATLEAEGLGLSIKVVRNRVNRGLAASRNIGLSHCTGDFVLPLDADDRIGPRFLELGVRALTRSAEYDVVVPTTGYFIGDDQADGRRFSDYACFLGNVPTLGLVANRFSTATALMRTAVVARFGYDEALDSYEDWSLYLRMSHAGVRFLVTNEIHFHYRRREGSMVRGITAQRHRRLLGRMHDTLPRPLPSSVATRFLPMLASGPEPEVQVEALAPMRYLLADRANELVKRAPVMHQRLKDNMGTLAAQQQRPLRYEVADRLYELSKQVPTLHYWLKRAAS